MRGEKEDGLDLIPILEDVIRLSYFPVDRRHSAFQCVFLRGMKRKTRKKTSESGLGSLS